LEEVVVVVVVEVGEADGSNVRVVVGVVFVVV
jgi:hypothetical protein